MKLLKAAESLSMLQPVLEEVSDEVREVVRSVFLLCTFGPMDEHRLSPRYLGLNELSWRHGSMTGLLQKAGLCATTTKQGPRLCLGAGTAERACLDSECHRVLYSQLECPVSSPIWAVLSVSMVMISLSNLTGEMFADATLFPGNSHDLIFLSIHHISFGSTTLGVFWFVLDLFFIQP